MFKYLRKKKISSSLKNNNRQGSFQRYSNIKNVVILFNYLSWNEVMQVTTDLRDTGKKVSLWTVSPRKEVIIPNKTDLYPVNIITPKDVSSTGSINPTLLKKFHDIPYDTIFDMSDTEEYPLVYLLANSSAIFHVGVTESDYKMYDFVLLKKDNMTLVEIHNQIKFYLNNIDIATNNA